MDDFRTYLLRGGRFNECRLTCPPANAPHTIVLFSDPVDEYDSGELYELKHGEYVLENDDDNGECG